MSSRRAKHETSGGRVKPLNPGITVLLVDDHALVRQAFRRIIDDEPGIDVVGETGSGAQAIQMAAELHPAVVLMDCSLPDIDGLAVAARIAKSFPKTAVLMCSMHSEENWVRRAMEAGARGYVFKSAMDLDLPLAIKQVAAGELLFGQLASTAKSRKTSSGSALSARELEVLQLIVKGKSNKQIAQNLQLSTHTVAVHRANIMKTLRIHRTAELVAFAIRQGLALIP
jgi:DNA-binding NarL/FixJ family response regulator